MRNIVSIQALRALAAFSVAILHFSIVKLMLTGRASEMPTLLPLASGVDVFFVISGFIIAYISSDLFGRPYVSLSFLALRITRIVPLYWISTFLAIPILHQTHDLTSVITSLFFIPHQTLDGSYIPINGVGWTLNFEMYFYIVFSFFLFFPRRTGIVGLCLFLLFSVLLGMIARPSTVVFVIWSDPIVIEFMMGLLICILYRRGVMLPRAARLCMIPIAVCCIWFFHAPTNVPTSYRFIQWGVPSAAILASLVLKVNHDSFSRYSRIVNLLGGSSYALYLIHPLMTGVVLTSYPYWIAYLTVNEVLVLAVITSVLVAVLVHLLFERPTTELLHALIRRLTARVTIPTHLAPSIKSQREDYAR